MQTASGPPARLATCMPGSMCDPKSNPKHPFLNRCNSGHISSLMESQRFTFKERQVVMKKNATHRTPDVETENLVEDAEGLLAATAHVAEEKVADARRRLNAAIERGRETWDNIQDRAVAGAKVTDRMIRDNPYRSLGIALGLGVVLGYLLNRRSSR